MPLLAIETTCDETAAAVIDRERRVLSSVVASQDALHARWRGVVPEVARVLRRDGIFAFNRSSPFLWCFYDVERDAIGERQGDIRPSRLSSGRTYPRRIARCGPASRGTLSPAA